MDQFTSQNILASLDLFMDAVSQNPDVVKNLSNQTTIELLQNEKFVTAFVTKDKVKNLLDLKKGLESEDNINVVEKSWSGIDRPGILSSLILRAHKTLSSGAKDDALIDNIFSVAQGIDNPQLREFAVDDQRDREFLNFTLQSGRSDKMIALVNSFDDETKNRIHTSWTTAITDTSPMSSTFFVATTYENTSHLLALRNQLNPDQQEQVDLYFVKVLTEPSNHHVKMAVNRKRVAQLHILAQGIGRKGLRRVVAHSEEFKKTLVENGMEKEFIEFETEAFSETNTPRQMAEFPITPPSPKGNPFLTPPVK